MAKGEPQAALAWLRAPTKTESRAILPRFPLEVGDEVHLAPVCAHEGGDDFLAHLEELIDRRCHRERPG